MMMFRPAQALTIHTANAIYQAGLAAIRAGQTSIDLADITTVDSSAVASLVGWQRAAKKQGTTLTFVNLPETLQHLAALYDVADMLQSASTPSLTPAPRQDLPHHH